MMKFNLGRDNICTQNTLTSFKYEKNILEIEEIQFQTSAIDNVRDILNNGIKRNNQELMTEKLIFRKEEFDKFDREKGIKQNYTELWMLEMIL